MTLRRGRSARIVMWTPTMHAACSAEPECGAFRCCFRSSALVFGMVVDEIVAGSVGPVNDVASVVGRSARSDRALRVRRR
jgi:hypothetical protein